LNFLPKPIYNHGSLSIVNCIVIIRHFLLIRREIGEINCVQNKSPAIVYIIPVLCNFFGCYNKYTNH